MVMLYEAEQDLVRDETADDALGAQIVGTLPPSLVMCQRAAAVLRAYLNDAKLGHYRLFHCPPTDLYDIEQSLERLGEVAACWQPLPPLVRDGEGMSTITHDADGSKIWEAGVLRLAKHDVVLARWYWIDAEDYCTIRVLWFGAAPSAKAFHALRDDVARHRRGNVAAVWQIVRGFAHSDGPRINRVAPADLFLADDIRQRIDRELIGFFREDVAAMYRTMAVPYRRGVLMHGPPGNGKTSLIRHVGAALPNVPAMLLRQAARFSGNELEEVIRRWSQQAPAILVIEDLNWLLKEINVSTFLNLLDGVEGSVTGGLLLIATSNYPEQLDPAINNRPGRFDVVIEIPCPDRDLRLAFFRRKLPEASDATVEHLAGETDELSFAHLQEVLRLSGLQAIHAGRSTRIDDDLFEAARTVATAYRHAERGFPAKQELPFGLLPLRDRKKKLSPTGKMKS